MVYVAPITASVEIAINKAGKSVFLNSSFIGRKIKVQIQQTRIE
jgi:hypothetical protein